MANPQPPARSGLPLPVAAIGDRTRARDDDHAGTIFERGFQRGFHVADNIDRRGKNFRQKPADDRRQLGTRGTRSADACARDLTRA